MRRSGPISPAAAIDMKLIRVATFVAFLISFALAFASGQSVTFSATKTVATSVRINGRSVHVEVGSGAVKKTQDIDLDTESVPHIVISDYGFDGNKGFSIWYFDEGMGTSTISRVFLYSTTQREFVELRPRCADEFVNLRVDRLNRTLISTYYKNNVPKLCRTKPPRTRH